MKKRTLLVLFLLWASMALGQTPTFVGQAVFTNAHRNQIIANIAGTGENVFNDKGHLQASALDFSDEHLQNMFDWMDPQTPIRTCTDCADGGGAFSPLPINILNPANQHNEDVYDAAIYAWATDDTALAQKVIDRLLAHALDDKLDFGNGTGANNPNATYGTANRFRVEAYSSRPFDQVSDWMKRNLVAYTLLKSRNLYTLSPTNEARLAGWFYDCYVWNTAIMNTIMNYFWGSGWRNDSFTLDATSNRPVSQISAIFLDNPYSDAAGNDILGFTVTDLQNGSLSNTRWGHVDYIAYYALAYNQAAGKDFVHDYWHMYMRFFNFPDGSNAEAHRGYQSTTPDSQNLGVHNYAWITTQNLIMTAHEHAVAKINGLSGMEIYTGREFFDYQTSLGTGDYASLSTLQSSNTSGGQKTLKQMIMANMKFTHQNYVGPLGWSPKRYQNVSPFPLLGQEDNRRAWVTAVAMANGYYNDPYLESVYKQETGNQLHSKKGQGTGATTIGAYEPNGGGWGMLYATDDLWVNTEGFTIPAGGNPPPSGNRSRRQNAINLINN